MKNFLAKFDGYKTYLVAVAVLVLVAAEKGLGWDVPGFETPDNWMLVVLNAFGLGALRAAITSTAAAGK